MGVTVREVGSRGFEIQGHRGARGLFPENTLEGFRAAMMLGVTIIELDVAVTADSVPVLFHDIALNPDIVRDATGRWEIPGDRLIRRLAAADLARFDVGRLRPGSAYAARYPQQIPQDGARIPSLRDAFALFVEAGVRADVELKTIPASPDLTVDPETMSAAVIADAKAMGALGLIDVRSFDWRGLRATARLRPELPLTFLTNAETAGDPELWWGCPAHGSVPRRVAAEHPGATWAPEHASLTRAALDEAHDLGLRVVPWTVNDPQDMRRLIAWGVDGLCTDYPDRAFAQVERSRRMTAGGLAMP